MKERPILMTPDNAQKCHVGAKTQTRRIVKGGIDIPCPYGARGDRLWVREAWCQRGEMAAAIYKADAARSVGAYGCVKWKPAIHMPRWACRTVLEITDVRVERLRELSKESAIREGIEFIDGRGVGHSGYRPDRSHGYVYSTARDAFAVLWESIHGKGSWALNTWVWVITFRRVDNELA